MNTEPKKRKKAPKPGIEGAGGKTRSEPSSKKVQFGEDVTEKEPSQIRKTRFVKPEEYGLDHSSTVTITTNPAKRNE